MSDPLMVRAAELQVGRNGEVPVNRELPFESSSRTLFSGVVFCWRYRRSFSAGNTEGQDELIEPEKTHLRIMRNNPACRGFAPASRTIFTRICLPHLLTSAPFVCLPDPSVLSAT